MRIFLRKNKKGKLRIWKIITYCITNISWVGEFSGSLGNFVLWISSRLFYYKNFLIFFFKFIQVAPLPTNLQKKKKKERYIIDTYLIYIECREEWFYFIMCMGLNQTYYCRSICLLQIRWPATCLIHMWVIWAECTFFQKFWKKYFFINNSKVISLRTSTNLKFK